MKIPGGGIRSESRIDAAGTGALTVSLADERALVSWTIRIEAERKDGGLVVVGSVQTIPPENSAAARVVAIARCPGVVRWHVTASTATADAFAELHLSTGGGGVGRALEAIDGQAFALGGVDYDSRGFAYSGALLTRPGRVLEVSALIAANTDGLDLDSDDAPTLAPRTFLILWPTSTAPADGTPIVNQAIPVATTGRTARTWSRPLLLAPAGCWTASASNTAQLSTGAAALWIAAQLE